MSFLILSVFFLGTFSAWVHDASCIAWISRSLYNSCFPVCLSAHFGIGLVIMLKKKKTQRTTQINKWTQRHPTPIPAANLKAKKLSCDHIRESSILLKKEDYRVRCWLV